MSECPSHYSGNGEITCSDAMKAMLYGDMEYAASNPMVVWWWLCAFKYLWRWPYKNGIDDLKKCDDCIQRLIAMLEEKEAIRYDP